MKSLNKYKNNSTQINKYKENFSNTEWLGIIIDSNDPLYIGRCKIRIFELFDDIEDELLPWAFPVTSSIFSGGEFKGSGSFHYPKVGSLVRVNFNNGDYYHPEYTTIETHNPKMIEEIKQSYENCHVLFYDEDENVKILYTQNDGLKIYHKESHITIDKNTHITIEHSNSTSKMTWIDGHIKIDAKDDIIEESPYIYLDGTDKVDVGHGADDQAVRCNELIQLLLKLAAAIDAKVPSSPGVNVNLVNQAIMNICSKIVWIAP